MLRTVFLSLALLISACSPIQHDVDALSDIDSKVNAILEENVEASGAARVSIRQFHDGDIDFAGNSDVIISNQYSYDAPGFSLLVPPSTLQNLPLNFFNQFIEKMWSGSTQLQCFTMLTSELRGSQLKYFLELHKLTQVAGCPLVDPETNTPRGMITSVFWKPLSEKTSKEMLVNLKQDADEINSLLRDKRGK